jgi:hypothetical protein
MAGKVSFLTNNRYDLQTGCWNWTGARSGGGYGEMDYLGRKEKIHRLSAHFYLGFDLNSPLQILHRCDNPSCFNPKHLFAGTQIDNMQDCISKGRFYQLGRTHCPKGHPYSGHNLIHRGDGGRDCRACMCRRGREYRKRLKEKTMSGCDGE